MGLYTPVSYSVYVLNTLYVFIFVVCKFCEIRGHLAFSCDVYEKLDEFMKLFTL